MPSGNWQLENPLKELNEHLGNAHKRVAGIIGFRLGQDMLNLDALSGSVRNIVETDFSGGLPGFVRLGRSITSAVTYRPKYELSLKELAAEILTEFYTEAVGAFQANRLRLNEGARALLVNMPEERRQAVLNAADEIFMPPTKEDMMREAESLIKEGLTPGTAACLGLFAGMALGIAVFRHPLFGGIGGIAGTAISYFLARSRMRKKAVNLLGVLPQQLYSKLRATLVANQANYQEIVNNSLNTE